MKNIAYASTVRSLIYAKVCTHPNIAYVIGKLDKYNLEIDH